MLLLLLLLVAAPSAFQGGAAGANAAGGPGLEARVDAVERKFEAELQPAEDRIRSELRNELTGMKGELKRLGGAAGPVQVRHLRFDGEAWRNTAVCMQCRSHTRSNRTITLHAGHCRGMINFHE